MPSSRLVDLWSLALGGRTSLRTLRVPDEIASKRCHSGTSNPEDAREDPMNPRPGFQII